MADDRTIPFDHERRMHERRAGGPITRVQLAPPVARVSWSGVWGGFLIATGIWLVLAALGAAVGLSSIGAGANLTAMTLGGPTAGWLYVSALIALFFGGAFGMRLAMVVDGAAAWLEATLVWTFALVLTIVLATTVATMAAAQPAAAQAVAQANPGIATTGTMRAGAWMTFIGMIIAWFVTVVGSFWGRAQSRGRARSLGMAA